MNATATEYGSFAVERDCCANLNCSNCRQWGRQRRIIAADNLTQGKADLLADLWKAFRPKVIQWIPTSPSI